jgi:hypothetical protein
MRAKADEGKYRLHFLICLNKYRIAGKFKLTDSSFNLLGQLLSYILDQSFIENDYESARYCMILSQTFYCETFCDLKSKVVQKKSLQDTIEKHDIWKSLSFWENFLKCIIFFLNLRLY